MFRRLLPCLMALGFIPLIAIPRIVSGVECSVDGFNRFTNDFYLEATSGEGAVGDIVPVELSLTVEKLHGRLGFFGITVSYDRNVAELVGLPVYSDLLDQFGSFPLFYELDPEDSVTGSGLHGIRFSSLLREAGREFLAEAITAGGAPPELPLMTLYFRLRGTPGDVLEIRFTDDEFGEGAGSDPGTRPCAANRLSYSGAEDGFGESGQLYAQSTRHLHGQILIIEGEPTQTEIPDLPVEARVYDPPPAPEDVEVTFELTGGTIRPGETGVPVEFHVTSNFEFTGYSLAGTFPAEYLQLASVEEHIGPGGLFLDAGDGQFSLGFLGIPARIGEEGERIHIATLYFDVSDSAGEAGEINISLESFREDTAIRYINWIGIRHTGGISDPLPVTTRVEPLNLINARFSVIGNFARFLRGDSNVDGGVDLSDAVFTLKVLFLESTEFSCDDAADANDDGLLDLADPIATLTALFLRSDRPIPPPAGVPGEDPTPDHLGCLAGIE